MRERERVREERKKKKEERRSLYLFLLHWRKRKESALFKMSRVKKIQGGHKGQKFQMETRLFVRVCVCATCYCICCCCCCCCCWLLVAGCLLLLSAKTCCPVVLLVLLCVCCSMLCDLPLTNWVMSSFPLFFMLALALSLFCSLNFWL